MCLVFFSFSRQSNLTAAHQAILKVRAILTLIQVLPLLKLSQRVTAARVFCEIHSPLIPGSSPHRSQTETLHQH